MTESRFNDRVDIEILKKDISGITSLIDKFDTTLNRLQEIAINLSKMVSLQEQRIEAQEIATKEINTVLEMRRIEHTNDIKELNTRITDVNKELSEKIDETEKTILSELSALRKEIKEDKTTTGNRINQIDLWRYTLIGGIIVIAWLAGKFEVIRSILN